jgi:flavodoxin I
MNSILVAYATMTGNTSTVAEAMLEHLGAVLPNVQVKLADLSDLNPVDLLEYDMIILGSSTWDDGDVNQVAREFLDKLESSKQDLSKQKFAIFSLGDSFYPDFCKAGDIIKESITKLEAKVVGDLHKIDGFPDDTAFEKANAWLDSVLK